MAEGEIKGHRRAARGETLQNFRRRVLVFFLLLYLSASSVNFFIICCVIVLLSAGTGIAPVDGRSVPEGVCVRVGSGGGASSSMDKQTYVHMPTRSRVHMYAEQFSMGGGRGRARR